MTNADDINLLLTCAICLDVASVDDAVETSCCHNLFCLKCIENVHPCPSCRQKDFQMVPAHFTRRLIGNLTISCPNIGCTVKVSRSNLAKHLEVQCAYRVLTCPDPQCQGFQCVRKLLPEHLAKKHEQLLADNFEKLWQKPKDTGSATTAHNTFDVRIETTRNNRGRDARLGSTGKFYCGGDLDYIRCTCCNGRCGPSNGCNCSGCMLLDVQKRQLPRGWLVNRDGAAARCSPQYPTKFYCGRMVMQHDRRTDGYCGPTNGEQCTACLRLNEQHRRYGKIWPDRQF